MIRSSDAYVRTIHRPNVGVPETTLATLTLSVPPSPTGNRCFQFEMLFQSDAGASWVL